MHIVGRPLQLIGQRADPDAGPHIQVLFKQRLQQSSAERNSGWMIAQVYQYLA